MKLPSYSFLVPASLLLGLAPFVPEPHLVEKVRWLLTGHPFRPIDVFDLFLHGTLPALLLVRVGRDVLGKGKGKGASATGASPSGGGSADGTGTPGTRAQRRREERERKKQ